MIEGLTLIAPSEPESCDSPYYSKDIVGKRGEDLALGGIWSVERETRSRSCNYLLLFCSRELSKYSLGDGSGRLDSQAVHEHSRSGSHLEMAGVQKTCATEWCGFSDNDKNSLPVVEVDTEAGQSWQGSFHSSVDNH